MIKSLLLLFEDPIHRQERQAAREATVHNNNHTNNNNKAGPLLDSVRMLRQRLWQSNAATNSNGSAHRLDDADVAAGSRSSPHTHDASSSLDMNTTTTTTTTTSTTTTTTPSPSDTPVLVLGMDISRYTRRTQFLVCASGVFGFSLLYGFLQELLSVHICNRQLGLFLAMAQFIGYTLWSFAFRTYVSHKQQLIQRNNMNNNNSTTDLLPTTVNNNNNNNNNNNKTTSLSVSTTKQVPLLLYLGLSLLRAVDLGMTNLAMQYVNYPAKTLMKSSRVVFTMIFGVLVARKRYRASEYLVVVLMVAGLAIFMHADANSSAVFHSLGILMLVCRLFLLLLLYWRNMVGLQ